jgi:hypothetical protein
MQGRQWPERRPAVVSVAPLPRMPRAKEEALAIGRTVVHRPTRYVSRESADIHGALRTWMDPARVVARSMAMVALAAFAILVLLPAAVAAQATASM